MTTSSPFMGSGFLRKSILAILPAGVLLASACSSDGGSSGTGNTGTSGAGSGGESASTAGNSGQGTAGASGSGQGGTSGAASGGSAGATNTNGGAAGSNVGGADESGGAGGTGGDAAGGSSGTTGTAGNGGDASGGAGGCTPTTCDTPPLRQLMVDPNLAANTTITFTAKQLDPMAGTSTPDTHAGDQEYGFVDTTKPMKGKLVMTLGGIGTCCGQGGIGGFGVGLGFHHLAIAMQDAQSSAPDQYKNVPENMRTDEDNRQMGDARMEAWDGVDRVSWLNINVHDSFAYRAALGLKYMQEQDPGGDWAYYLNADDTVRWSDVYLVGYSYGSQTLAVVAKYVRIGRGIATSGPVDEGFPNATWIHAPSVTPLDRMYGLFGSTNLDTKVQTTQAAGWLGDPVTVNANATLADLMMAHLFILQGQGHSEFCAGDGGQWKALCTYAFGVMQ